MIKDEYECNVMITMNFDCNMMIGMQDNDSHVTMISQCKKYVRSTMMTNTTAM